MLKGLDKRHKKLIKLAKENVDQSGTPQFPPKKIQEQFVGSSYSSAFEEAYQFYKLLIIYSEALGMPINCLDSNFLDFGCGWGRFLRYAMLHFPQERLHGVDIDPEIIEVCKSTSIAASYNIIEPKGNLPFSDNSISHAMAYSVFTHLPEELHKSWISEITRVLRPGGIFCATIESRKFIDFLASLNNKENIKTDWHLGLSKFADKVSQYYEAYEDGRLTYIPTGGGGIRTSEIYGDAIVPKGYLEATWHGMAIRAFIDEGFWQTVVVAQKL